MSRVSVIIPAYNYGHFLEECVESVRTQTYPDWEIAICDDGSSDDTPRIGAALAARDPSRIRYHRLANGGVSAARNFGIANTSGEFILPLDADDVLCPNALEEFVRALRGDPNAGYAFSNLLNLGALAGEPRYWLQGPFFRKFILSENTAACTSMWRRTLWDKGVRYRPVLIEDWDLWLQIVAKGHHGAYIPEVLFHYRMHLSGRSARNRYLYLPALFELMINNPALYDERAVAWAKSCMVHSPQCWKKTSFVLIPPEEEASAPVSATVNLCREAGRRGHFVSVVGSYPAGITEIPGVAFLNVHDLNDVEALAGKIGMSGPEVIVISARSPLINRRLKNLKNVSEVLGWNDIASREPAAVVEWLLKLHADLYPQKRAKELTYWETLKSLEDLSSTPSNFSEQPPEQISRIEAVPRRTEDRSYSRASSFMTQADSAVHPWLAFFPAGSVLRDDWEIVCSRYIQKFGPDTLFFVEGAHLPPLLAGALKSAFAALSSRARFRDVPQKDGLLIHREILKDLGGLNRNLAGSGAELEDAFWRAEAMGCKIVWLPRGLLLCPLRLEASSRAEAAHNEEVTRIARRASAFTEPDYRKLSSYLPPLLELPLSSALTPRVTLREELSSGRLTDRECSEALLTWGMHCLNNQEEPSAREAFEDVLGITQGSAGALAGLSHCALIRGQLPAAAHYAHAALRRQPRFEAALQVLKVLEDHGIR